MKFRFCGDADCPDWALAEMTTLSRLSSVKLKLLTTLVAQSIARPPLDVEKVEKLFGDSKQDVDLVEVKSCVACVGFIIRSAARSGCDAAALGGELQQLGLPREHAHAIRRVYTDQAPSLKAALHQKTLRVNRLEGVEAKAVPQLQVSDLSLKIQGQKEIQVRLPRDLLANILEDARSAREVISELATGDHAI